MANFRNFFNLHFGEADKKKVLEEVQKNISFRGSNLWILACAILIASIGLNMNSTAVIIGAMLISPLMGPITGAGFALATYDFELLKKAGKNLLIATLVSLTVSTVYFYLSPFKEVESELLSRTSPTIYDVLIAFFGGIVGAVAITRLEKGNPIPGVAIATALMPPLCTAGFALAAFNLRYFVGAMYLYSINCFFIAISTFLIIKYLKYKPIVTDNEAFDKKLRITISVLMMLMIVPSSYLAYSLLNQKKYAKDVENFIKEEFSNKGYTVIYKKINYNSKPKELELAFLSRRFDSTEIKQIKQDLTLFGLKNTRLTIRQNTSDLKQEILSEIDKSNNTLSEKDIRINLLTNELKSFDLGNEKLADQVKILFPNISNFSIGRLNSFSSNDSIKNNVVFLYQSKEPIDELKLKAWIENQLDLKNIELIRQEVKDDGRESKISDKKKHSR